jgi:flavin reductase (DIM6/NTAB) family NADH-FMN oxidoreductase RutF
MDTMTLKETVRNLANGLYTVSASNGARRATTVVTSVSQVSATPLLVMAAMDPKKPVFGCLAESRAADVTIAASRRVLHCVVRHIVRVDSRAIVIMEVLQGDLAA